MNHQLVFLLEAHPVRWCLFRYRGYLGRVVAPFGSALLVLLPLLLVVVGLNVFAVLLAVVQRNDYFFFFDRLRVHEGFYELLCRGDF